MNILRHFIPLDVKTEQKFSPKIFIFDFFFIIGFVTFGFVTQSMITTMFQIPYLAFNVFLGIYLSRKSRNNPEKRIFQSIWMFLRRPRTTYVPIELPNARIKGEREMRKHV